MRRIRFVLLLGALWPVLSRAAESCPWLDTATASGELNASNMGVTVKQLDTINPETKDADAVCEFSKREGSLLRALRIEVRTVDDPAAGFSPYTGRCSSKPTPLKAVGNAALACTLTAKRGQTAAQVVGRLRDRIFVIQVSADSAWISRDALLEKTCSLADLISGNLF